MGICNCDKCGEEVDPKNDAVLWQFILENNNWYYFYSQSRHLYPTEKCEGSPSRVKYIAENEYGKKAYQILQEANFN